MRRTLFTLLGLTLTTLTLSTGPASQAMPADR
jgi:hypothetical protein